MNKINATEYISEDNIREVDFQPAFRDLALNAAVDMLLVNSAATSIVAATQLEKAIKIFSDAFTSGVKYVARRERLKAFCWILNGKDFRDTCHRCHQALGKILEIATASSNEDDNARLQMTVLELVQSKLGEETTRNEMLNILFAARDTMTSFLDCTFYALARETTLYSNLREEIVSILGDDPSRIPTDAELGRMTTLDNVLSESMSRPSLMLLILLTTYSVALRLFPPVPVNGRFCDEDTTLPTGGGADGQSPILVPKGTLICYSVFAMQRSTAVYGSDADKFLPSRWDKKSEKECTQDWSFVPFNGGPRKCLGGKFRACFRAVRY
jgi:cytochrome P450